MSKTTGCTLRHHRASAPIAILVVTYALVGVFAPSAASAVGTNENYGYSCCGGGFGTVNYHPGETIKVDWIRTSLRSSGAPAKTVNLSVSASGPFPTIAAAKKAFSSSHPAVGRTNFAAPTLHVSDKKGEFPVSLLHVPLSAEKGFYELTIKIVKGKNSSGGGAIFTVRP